MRCPIYRHQIILPYNISYFRKGFGKYRPAWSASDHWKFYFRTNMSSYQRWLNFHTEGIFPKVAAFTKKGSGHWRFHICAKHVFLSEMVEFPYGRYLPESCNNYKKNATTMNNSALTHWSSPSIQLDAVPSPLRRLVHNIQ